MARDVSLRIRMTEDERAMVAALAKSDGLSSSDIVRLLVRRAYKEAFGDKKPPRR